MSSGLPLLLYIFVDVEQRAMICRVCKPRHIYKYTSKRFVYFYSTAKMIRAYGVILALDQASLH